MPDQESELKVAQAVSSAAAAFGLGEWGEPIRVDDGTAEAQVDYRFDAPRGRVALEVSSIVDSRFVATANASYDRVDRLRTAAIERGAGRWDFVLLPDAVVRDVLPDLINIIQTRTELQVGRSTDGLPSGVNGLWYDPDGEDTGEIMTLSSATATSLGGLTVSVQACVNDNAVKLTAAEAEFRYVAIDAQMMHATDPAQTRVPMLPEGVDGVFVVRRHTSLMRGSPVVWYSNGSDYWQSNGEAWD